MAFPSNPSEGTTYEVGKMKYRFDGIAWNVVANPSQGDGALPEGMWYTATDGQTEFVVQNGYNKDSVEVFVEGLLYDSSKYVATDGSKVVFNAGLTAGQKVYVKSYEMINEMLIGAY